MVVVPGFTQVFKGKHIATLPASAGLVNLDSHPVWLVVTLALFLTSASDVTVVEVTWHKVWVGHGALAFSNRRFDVEHIDTFSLTQQLESLQTGGLVQLGGNGSWLSTWTDQRGVGTSDLRQLGGSLGLELGGTKGDSGDGEKPGLSSSTCKSSREPVMLVSAVVY